MIEALKGVGLELLKSKKAMALLAGLISVAATYALVRWLGLPEEQANELAGNISARAAALASAYMVGQGLADHGKEKAKVELEADAEEV